MPSFSKKRMKELMQEKAIDNPITFPPGRVELLQTGIQLTAGDRNVEYGEPYENFSNIALLWSAYLHGKYGGQLIDPLQFNLSAEDVAWLNTLQKTARTFIGRPKSDTYVDAATYAAIAGEVAFIEKEE